MAIHFTTIQRGRKHRVHQWVNTETLEPLFGIQANLSYGVWAHVIGEDRRPLLYERQADAKAEAKVLSRKVEEAASFEEA